MAPKTQGILRSVAILIFGMLLFIVASACLDHLFAPGRAVLLQKMYTPLSPKEFAVLYKQLSHGADLTVYVVEPLAAIVVGLFVGLLQRGNAVLLAGCCLIPNFLVGWFTDTQKVWAHSLKGISSYSFDHVLPFAVAMITAAGCQYLLSLRRHPATTA